MSQQCMYCEKYYSNKQNLSRHQLTCPAMKLYLLNKSLKEKIQEQQQMFEKKIQEQREQYDKEIHYLKEQLTEFKTQIFEIAKQPKTTISNQNTQTHNNRNTNIINQLAIYDLNQDQITQVLTQHYNLDTFQGGPEEIAKLAARFLLTDAQSQKPKVACTDLSRKNFKYVDEEQEVQVDPGFQKTHDLIKEPLSKANIRVYVDELQKDDKYHDQWRKNEEFISDRTGFSDKVIKWMV